VSVDSLRGSMRGAEICTRTGLAFAALLLVLRVLEIPGHIIGKKLTDTRQPANAPAHKMRLDAHITFDAHDASPKP
jgi:hypothetical protein